MKTKYNNSKVFLPIMGWNYWMGLPAYAHMYIQPAYNRVCDTEGLVNFLDHFIGEWYESNNEAKKTAILAVVGPIYRDWTGRNLDTNLIAL